MGEPQPGATGQGWIKLAIFHEMNVLKAPPDRMGFKLSKSCCITQNPLLANVLESHWSHRSACLWSSTNIKLSQHHFPQLACEEEHVCYYWRGNNREIFYSSKSKRFTVCESAEVETVIFLQCCLLLSFFWEFLLVDTYSAVLEYSVKPLGIHIHS